ncbi:3-methyladenine DNA glycosylase [Campylobacter majalis]|uniref:3-methyladenine DNA glycosylase n=1 Tax=Campylobacter majalis TaxID=2790656 RepID=UPI003D6900AD
MQTRLFCALFDEFKSDLNALKWPGEGSFEVVIGAILVQNTTWKNVEKALENLRKIDAINLDSIANMQINELALMIKPSGFYNTKAKRLSGLAKAIKKDFFDFENFKQNVSREWLLSIKGVGAETCDAILCYACDRDEMVVDAYAIRILRVFGYEFEGYDEAKEWLSCLDFDKIKSKYLLDDNAHVFKIFHATIMAFAKKYSKGKMINESGNRLLLALCD